MNADEHNFALGDTSLRRQQRADDEQRRARLSLSRTMSRLLTHAILIAGGIAVLIPFLWMISASLKPDWQIFQIPPQWLPAEPLWSNYWKVLTGAGIQGGFSFLGFTANTVFITVFVLCGRLLTASMAAFGFARLRFRGRGLLFILMLSTMMIPGQVTMVPLYILFKNLHLVDTYWPLILPVWFGGGAFFIFLLRQFIMSLPQDYVDAARVDGCGWFGIYWRIILPLLKPALGTVAVFSFMETWTDFMGPLIYISSQSKYTLAVGLHFFSAQASGSTRPLWNLTMAATLISLLPPIMLFFFAQRYYIQGVVVSGVKG